MFIYRRKYYHNANLEETTWDRPHVLDLLDQCLQARREKLGPEWEELEDQESGRNYFVHIPSGATQWDMPPHDCRKAENALPEASHAPISPISLKSSSNSSSSVSSTPPQLVHTGEDSNQKDYPSSASSMSTLSPSEDEDGKPREFTPKLAKRRARKRELMRRKEEFEARASLEELKAHEASRAMRRCLKHKLPSLNLANLLITVFPEQLPLTASFLVDLDLSNNCIEEISSDVKLLRKSLKKLNLSANRLREVPFEVWYLDGLETLNLRRNKIEHLPREKGNLVTLRELQEWELGVDHMKALTTLLLDNNRLRTLPNELTQVKTLKHLSLTSNALSSLPEAIGELSNLAHLSCEENELRDIPESICALSSLVYLNLSHNKLYDLPAEIGELKSLHTLDVSFNQMKKLPVGMVELKESLRRLNVSHNSLTMLHPHFFSSLTGLNMLDVSHNDIKRIPDDIELMQCLVYLNMRANKIENGIPKGLTELRKLRFLDLSHNRISRCWCEELPEPIFEFLCSHNNLSSLPDELFKNTRNIESVDLSHNNLSSVHFFSPICAINLDISHNRFTDIPEFFRWENSRLETLAMSFNGIQCLHNSFFQSLGHSLQTLLLDNNKLESIPEGIKQCSGLVLIALDHNNLHTSPRLTELKELANLRSYSLHSNPIACLSLSEKQSGVNTAELLLATGDAKGATKAISTSIKSDASNPVVHEVCGRALLMDKRFGEADSCLSSLVYNRETVFPRDCYYAGLAKMKARRFSAAIDDFDVAMSSEPFKRLVAIRAFRAECYMQVGRYEACLNDCKHVLYEEPEHQRILCVKAECLLKQGDVDGSFEVLEALLHCNKDHPQGQYLKGLILRGQRRHNEAVQSFDACVQLFEKVEACEKELGLSMMMKSSALASTNRTQKAHQAYVEAKQLLQA